MAVAIEVTNRSGQEVEEEAASRLAARVLADEGVCEGELGIAFVGADEIRRLKSEHLGVAEATDVLSFPIDGRDELPEGLPRQLGDVVLCPEVTGEHWQAALVHGLLHLLGYAHGADMRARETAHGAPYA
jgi:probable rRNA maturation factor